MAKATRRLTVTLGDQPVAELENVRGRVRIHYLPEAIERYAGQPLLSCALPVQRRADDATDFFDGVLPEGQFRAALAAKASVSAADTFGLLARYGRDVAGAIVVSDDDPDNNVDRQPDVEALSAADLEDEVSAIPDQPLGIHDDSELSIAGMQNKLLLVKIDETSWGRPTGGAPSTHILKLDSQAHTGVVAAEAAAMRLARELNLTTVDVELSTISDIDCLIVERFDREIIDGEVRRIHQEDICQAMGLPAVRKYELPGRGAEGKGGGPEFSQLAELLDIHARDHAAALVQLARVATFTALIGNSDAHGKNLALLHRSPSDITLAPLYDTVPTALFPKLKDEAAMTIGGVTKLSLVTKATIAQEARHWSFDAARAVDEATRLAEELRAAIDGGSVDADSALAELVRERCERFLSGAAG